MTTPNQTAPDGAYVIGGGDHKYGQALTDKSSAHLMLGGFTSIASITNPIEAVSSAMQMFADALLQLPLEVLQLFEPMIPDVLEGVFSTIGGAVGAIVDFFQTLGSVSTAVFNNFVTALLPDFILQPIQDLIQLLITVLDLIPFIGEPAGDALEYLASIFGLMRDTTQVSQSSADTANVGLAILAARVDGLSGAITYWDTFDRDTPPSTPAVDALGPGYTLMYGSGSGVMETRAEDNGTTIWDAVGFADRTLWIRRDTALTTTNNQRISAVFNNFTYGYAGNQAHIFLMGRWNDDGTTMATSSFVMARIGDNACEIGYVIDGTYTRFGSPVSCEHANGDLWDLEVGTASDPWQFRLLQNNALRVDRTDLGHLSMIDTIPGTLYRDSGIGVDCAIGAGPFGTTYQIGPPKIQVLAGANRA